MLVIALTAVLIALSTGSVQDDPSYFRPPPSVRKFKSKAIDDLITTLSAKMKDPELAVIFTNCLPNPLDTTVNYTKNGYGEGVPDTFVITGDIPAMWLRDGMFQVWPYIKYANQDEHLKDMLRGVINRMAASILIDHYANAYNYADEGSPWQHDTRFPPMNKKLWEGKYELDTLLSVLRMSNGYYAETKDLTPFKRTDWVKAVSTILDTIEYEQTPTLDSFKLPRYFFARDTETPTDTLEHMVGWPAAWTGMAKTAFRPSDDAAKYPFLVPINAMATRELGLIADLLTTLGQPKLAAKAKKLRAEIQTGLDTWGIVNHTLFGRIYSYETDGYASWNFMDDANTGLLSLPYLGILSPKDEVYNATRQFILSEHNPYWFKGTAGSGVGSPHTKLLWAWPMGITMQAFTSESDEEIMECLARWCTYRLVRLGVLWTN
eukprot:TRINITY_DN66882_c4_g7_i1.p1 TRINITY_DN66882_c4_g7~~TRINITY_DN66882_c4_g7_i1.p1  ORF type:complete len:466 (+),score=28.41 TRINITY_DN66882_c4_g7_i1:99-1400(+)